MLDQGVVLKGGKEEMELINHLGIVEVFDQGVVLECVQTLYNCFISYLFISYSKGHLV